MNPTILARLAATPWAIIDSALADIMARLDGLTPDLLADATDEQVEGYYAAAGRSGARAGTVAVVPVMGMISQRDSLFTMLMGGTSTNRLVTTMRTLAADDTVASILLNIDSPGGQAGGLVELAAEIRRTRQVKRVVAIANPVMGSAAAWIGWSADEVVANPEAIVGSQGVFALYLDISKALEMEGIEPIYIASSGAKAAGRPGLPLDDDTRAEMQAIVDEENRLFVADVAEGRGITPAQVKEQYGNGAVFSAREAKKRGMVDRIASYSDTVARMSGVKPAGVRAELAALSDEELHADLVAVIEETEVVLADAQVSVDAAARLRLDADYRFTHR